ncbi:MAG: hypothetical protein ABI591_00540 [Kofleriaceae bacterium]
MKCSRSLAVGVLLASATASADDAARQVDDDTFAVDSKGGLAVDAGLVVASPAALSSGMSTGVVAGITRSCGCHLAYGVRASWSTITESSLAWTVEQTDLRLRVTGSVRHEAGRGSVALQLGLGPTFVHEVRTRNSAMEAGRNDLTTRAWGTVPAGDLDAVFAVHVAGPWVAVASGGPSLDHFGGAFVLGWSASLGVAWQP